MADEIPTPDPLALDALAGTVDRFGRLWNAYEVHGVEHIPDGPCLLVAYHGLMPLDGWYLLARLYRDHGIEVHGLADRWLFRVPGLSQIVRTGLAIPGDPESAHSQLRDGHKLLVSPGGVREAIAGRSWHYRVHWRNRLGFARLALRAGVPLVPVFGENVEELYRAPGIHTRPFQDFYERMRWPLVPLVGLGPLPFPVKVRTWIGPPVVPAPEETPEQLRDRTREALQALMDAHQPRRPRLLRALVERLRGPTRN